MTQRRAFLFQSTNRPLALTRTTQHASLSALCAKITKWNVGPETSAKSGWGLWESARQRPFVRRWDTSRRAQTQRRGTRRAPNSFPKNWKEKKKREGCVVWWVLVFLTKISIPSTIRLRKKWTYGNGISWNGICGNGNGNGMLGYGLWNLGLGHGRTWKWIWIKTKRHKNEHKKASVVSHQY